MRGGQVGPAACYAAEAEWEHAPVAGPAADEVARLVKSIKSKQTRFRCTCASAPMTELLHHGLHSPWISLPAGLKI